MDPRRAKYWESVGVEWRRKPTGGLWREHCDAVHIRWLTRGLAQSPSAALLKTDLFDEAVGGGLHRMLKAHARVVVGMDLSASVARAARTRNPGLEGLCADACHLPFADGVFGAVVSNSTLDHFHTPDEFLASLREIHRVLEPGGRLLLTMDNPVNPVIALRNALPISLLNRIRLVPYYVGVTFGPRELRALLEPTGFQVVDFGSLLHCLRVVALPASRVLDGIPSKTVQRGWLRALMACEELARLPSRYLTGNFVTVLATKPR